MRCQPYVIIFPVVHGTPLVSAPLSIPFPILAPHSVLQSHSLLSIPVTVASCPWVLADIVSSFSLFPPFCSLGPMSLASPCFWRLSKHRPLAENTISLEASKTVWKSRRSQCCVSRYLWVPGILLVSVPLWHSQEQGCGLGRAEATAGCHCHFITHLLIVVNGDFTAPLALVMSCGSALMEGEGKASLETPSRIHMPSR